MSSFKEEVELELRSSIGLLSSLRDRDQLSMVPEHEWAEVVSQRIADKFKGRYVPFVSEVEEFNATMGKPNNYVPNIPENTKEWMFVYDFILEELEEYKAACEAGDIVEVLDALCDIAYVSIGNGTMLHGLKDKLWDADAKAYAAMISLMDVTVGRIMQKLKEFGIDENTIVFFTSDNGAAESSQIWKVFESNAPLRGVKRDPYEGGIRVPMIVRYPTEIAQGEINDLPWYFADVLPTLAELTGMPVPEGIDGTSVLATLKGGKQDLSNREMYWEFYEKDGWRAVRFGDWKAIQRDMHKKEHQPIEIYNIKNDISEINNLAAKYPELVEKAKHIFEESHIPSEHYVWKHL